MYIYIPSCVLRLCILHMGLGVSHVHGPDPVVQDLVVDRRIGHGVVPVGRLALEQLDVDGLGEVVVAKVVQANAVLVPDR